MKTLTPAERILHLEKLVEHPGWTEVLRPVLAKRVKSLEREILSGELDSADYKLKTKLADEIGKIIKKPDELLSTELRKERDSKE